LIDLIADEATDEADEAADADAGRAVSAEQAVTVGVEHHRLSAD
jgi:hypothetical protein